MPRRTAGVRLAAARALVAGLWLLAWSMAAGPVLGASPTPGPGGDPRSSGQGPGLVGDPAFAILAVLAIGIATLVITLVYIRFTGGRRA